MVLYRLLFNVCNAARTKVRQENACFGSPGSQNRTHDSAAGAVSLLLIGRRGTHKVHSGAHEARVLNCMNGVTIKTRLMED